jgi:uncharacterized protein with von Willebrand factor type A (vWA) domain
VRQKKHLPSLALALVIDKSGSMAGVKMELTKEAASATVDFLSDRDSVGVIAFDSRTYPVVNITKVEDKRSITGQIQSIQPVGGTNMYPGLRSALESLQSNDAQIKHIIVLSDGRSEGGDFRGIARSIRDAGITLTAVAVGDDADIPMMTMLAEIGGGRFYAVDRPENLPRSSKGRFPRGWCDRRRQRMELTGLRRRSSGVMLGQPSATLSTRRQSHR